MFLTIHGHVFTLEVYLELKRTPCSGRTVTVRVSNNDLVKNLINISPNLKITLQLNSINLLIRSTKKLKNKV